MPHHELGEIKNALPLHELAGAAICPTGVGGIEGNHIVHFEIVHAYAGNRRYPFLESVEELGLACAVPADRPEQSGGPRL